MSIAVQEDNSLNLLSASFSVLSLVYIATLSKRIKRFEESLKTSGSVDRVQNWGLREKSRLYFCPQITQQIGDWLLSQTFFALIPSLSCLYTVYFLAGTILRETL